MTPLQRTLLATGLPAAALVSFCCLVQGGPAPLLVNESPSLPRGLYLRAPSAPPERGAVVALRQPAAVRPYLARLGVPAETRLLKRVAAAPGDQVCADGARLVAPHRLVSVQARDRVGASLPVWRGCGPLGPDERFLLGDTPTSFDSRYFGPVPSARIEGVYRAIVTW